MDHALGNGWFPAPFLALGRRDRSILEALRAVMHPAGGAALAMSAVPYALTVPVQDGQFFSLQGVLAGLADIDRALRATGSRGWRLEPPGSLAMSRDERRLLRAVRVAATGNRRLLDNYLFKLALDRGLRARLAAIIEAVAGAGQDQSRSAPAAGHETGRDKGLSSAEPVILPAPALAALRARGCSPDNLIIDWISD